MTSTVACKIDKAEVNRIVTTIRPLIDNGAHFYVLRAGDTGYDSNCPHNIYYWHSGQGSFFCEGTPEFFAACQQICINVAGVEMDSSANHVHREPSGFVTQHGEEVFVHMLLAEHEEHGYLAYPDGGAMRWFGTGEKFPSYIEILREYRKEGWLITEEQWQTMA